MDSRNFWKDCLVCPGLIVDFYFETTSSRHIKNQTFNTSVNHILIKFTGLCKLVLAQLFWLHRQSPLAPFLEPVHAFELTFMFPFWLVICLPLRKRRTSETLLAGLQSHSMFLETMEPWTAWCDSAQNSESQFVFPSHGARPKTRGCHHTCCSWAKGESHLTCTCIKFCFCSTYHLEICGMNMLSLATGSKLHPRLCTVSLRHQSDPWAM